MGICIMSIQSTHLPADGHYSSAYDLALIARYAMKNPQFAKIVATEKKTIPWAGHEWSRLLVNHNKFITNPELYPGVDGVKNGYTKEAGYCLVASAKRNGMRLIAVVLNSPDPSAEVMQLFDYGFENFDRTLLLSGGETVKTISLKNNQHLSLVAAEPFYAALGLKEAGRVIVNVNVPQDVSLPVKKGEVYGKAVYEVDEQVIGMVNLLAARDVEKDTWLSFVWRMFVDAITKFS